MVEKFEPIIRGGAAPVEPPRDLSKHEQELYERVEAHFKKESFQVQTETASALSKEEKYWLSRECILRYLRASKWVEQTAIQRLEATLKWRRDYGLTSFITAEHVEPEGVTGKQVIYGFDTDGRPALYLLPSRQNTDDPVRQLQYTVWILERCIDLMDPGVEALDLLIDFADRAKNPSLGTAKAMLNILQNHYPERLGRALIINVPFLVNAFFKLIMPFVDPLTRVKIRFNPSVVQEGLFQPEMITQSWGGDVDFIYTHEKYWPVLLALTSKRREQNFERWERLGGSVGLSEWDIKGSTLNEKLEEPSEPGEKTT